jgi:hypothetical protein
MALVLATGTGSAIGYLQFCQTATTLFLRILKYHFSNSTIFPVPLFQFSNRYPSVEQYFSLKERIYQNQEINWVAYL